MCDTKKPDHSRAIKVEYVNYRGETAVRTVIPIEGKLYWGSNEFHKEPQWLLEVWDIEKGLTELMR